MNSDLKDKRLSLPLPDAKTHFNAHYAAKITYFNGAPLTPILTSKEVICL